MSEINKTMQNVSEQTENEKFVDQTIRTSDESGTEFEDTIDDSFSDPNFEPDETITGNEQNRPVTKSNSFPFNIFNSSFAFITGEPNKYEDAAKNENWIKAMDDEYNSLMQNGTWTSMKLPANKSAIDNKWVYKIKTKSNGEIERYKARLVIRGFSQRFGFDYFETFSPVVKYTSVRTILAIAAAKNLTLKQFDVKTAFLYSELEEEIYMKQPKGYDDNTGRVCKLLKSLYGLKQASRCWNMKFTSFIKKFNFKVSSADSCVFINTNGHMITYLALYIDDGLMASNDLKFVDSVIQYLRGEFEIKFSEVDTYLGLQIKKNSVVHYF